MGDTVLHKTTFIILLALGFTIHVNAMESEIISLINDDSTNNSTVTSSSDQLDEEELIPEEELSQKCCNFSSDEEREKWLKLMGLVGFSGAMAIGLFVGLTLFSN